MGMGILKSTCRLPMPLPNNEVTDLVNVLWYTVFIGMVCLTDLNG